MKMNFTRNPNKKQAKSKINLLEGVKSLPKGFKRTLNTLIWAEFRLKIVYPAQAIIGKWASHGTQFGYCRGYTNRAIAKLRAIGFIKTEYRHMNTSLYSVSSFFYEYENVKILKKLLPSLFFVWVYLFTQLNLKGIGNKDYLYIHPKRNGNVTQLQELVMKNSPKDEIIHSLTSKVPTRIVFSDKLNQIGDALNLSNAAKIKLSGFTVQVLEHGYNYYSNFKKKKVSPFGLLFSFCQKASYFYKEPYDLPAVRTMLSFYNIDKDAPLYLTKDQSFTLKKDVDSHRYEYHRPDYTQASLMQYKDYQHTVFNSYKEEVSLVPREHIDKINKTKVVPWLEAFKQKCIESIMVRDASLLTTIGRKSDTSIESSNE